MDQTNVAPQVLHNEIYLNMKQNGLICDNTNGPSHYQVTEENIQKHSFYTRETED